MSARPSSENSLGQGSVRDGLLVGRVHRLRGRAELHLRAHHVQKDNIAGTRHNLQEVAKVAAGADKYWTQVTQACSTSIYCA